MRWNLQKRLESLPEQHTILSVFLPATDILYVFWISLEQFWRSCSNDGKLVQVCTVTYHGMGQAGWGPVKWPTEQAAEAQKPDRPLSVLLASRRRRRHRHCCRLYENPPVKTNTSETNKQATHFVVPAYISGRDRDAIHICKYWHLQIYRHNLSV